MRDSYYYLQGNKSPGLIFSNTWKKQIFPTFKNFTKIYLDITFPTWNLVCQNFKDFECRQKIQWTDFIFVQFVLGQYIKFQIKILDFLQNICYTLYLSHSFNPRKTINCFPRRLDLWKKLTIFIQNIFAKNVSFRKQCNLKIRQYCI